MASTHRAVVHLSPAIGHSVEMIETPAITAGSVIVRVISTGLLSYMRDVLTGKRPYPVSLPFVPGLSCIARVSAVGPDSVHLQPGQLVFSDMTVYARDEPANSHATGTFKHDA